MGSKKTIITPDLEVGTGDVKTGTFFMQFDEDDPIKIASMYDGGKVTIELSQSGEIEFQSGTGRTFRLKLIKEE